MNSVEMLKQDHEKVRRLFREYGAAGERQSEMRDVVQQVLMELHIHSKLEEEIFYPAVRAMGGELEEEVEEGYQEHRQVDTMIEELKAMDPNAPNFADTFQALMGAVEYHVAEEEAEMLPKAEQTLAGKDAELTQKMMQRKQELMQQLMR